MTAVASQSAAATDTRLSYCDGSLPVYFLGSFHALRETRSLSGIQSKDNGDTLGIWKKREGMKEMGSEWRCAAVLEPLLP